MIGPLIAIVGDTSADRKFDPPMKDPAKAKRAAEELGGSSPAVARGSSSTGARFWKQTLCEVSSPAIQRVIAAS